MTNLEIALSCLSIIETIIAVILHRRIKNKLDAERKEYENKRIEYERLIEALPIGRNLL